MGPPQTPPQQPLQATPTSVFPRHQAPTQPAPCPIHPTIPTTLPYQEDNPQDLTPVQSKYPRVHQRPLMMPSGPALDHPFAPALTQLATEGCPSGLTDSFPLHALEAAIERGAHPSARTPEAAKALLEETNDKIAQGFARLIPWEELRQCLPEAIRISPIAAIPHKSRLFRMILDLSYMFTIDGAPWSSVNQASNPQEAPTNSMSQLGHVLPRLVHAIATSPDEQGPWVFIKFDIKDGFWRMIVPDKDEFNFCYVLPRHNDTDPIQIVVPSSLQMGWKYSPAYFCAASETARDVAATLLQQPELPPHPLEDISMSGDDIALLQQLQNPNLWSPNELPQHLDDLNHLLEVYVDDFAGAVQSTNPQVLLHHSRALLHGIHSIFPPSPPGNDDEPVSLKKLHAGEGIWAFRKEILGWIFDGINRTIELPIGKADKIRQSVKQALQRQHMPVPEFQSLLGKLQHACLAIPNGRALLSPLYKLLPKDHSPSNKRKHVQIPKGSEAHHALQDLRTILKLVANRPTLCSQLVPGWPHYVGFCDASKYGCGGIWLSGKDDLHPTLWRVAWPPDIVHLLTIGKLTINDLEMAGLLFQYLVLENLIPDLTNKHAAAWVDNTSAVSWARKMSSKQSFVGQRLVRALALRQVTKQCSPLAPWHIAGRNNNMADLASRSFRKAGKGTYDLTDAALSHHFNSKFALTQDASWHMYTLPNKLTSLVFSELRLERQPMGSWLRPTTIGQSFGPIGANSSTPSVDTLTHTSPTSPNLNASPLSSPLPLGYDMEMSEEKIRLALSEYNKRWQPSPRPSNWLDNPAPRTSTKGAKPTGRPSNNR